MQKKLLESIIALTAQRDIEALEHSLLVCLGEMFRCLSLAVIKPISEHGAGLVRETLRLSPDATEGGYIATKDSEPMIADEALRAAIANKTSTECNGPHNEALLYFPVTDNERLLAIVAISTAARQPALVKMLDSLGKVYRNYHNLLSENSHDSLTGLLNRKTIDKNFNQLIASQRKHQKMLVEKHTHRQQRTLHDRDQVFLAIADIDHFKHINDAYGHIYGDEILLLMTKIMRESFRSNDLLFRFGGEEFVVLLEPTDQDQARKVLEKFRKRVEEYDFPQVQHVTISIGFTAVADYDHLTQVVDRADKALYFAKDNGRNATHYYDKLLQQGLLNKSEFVGSVELF